MQLYHKGTTTVPMDLELFFTDVLAQPVSEEGVGKKSIEASIPIAVF